jgi:hypothetical protein
VHASLANEDKIDAILYKQRLISYPEGQDIAAVECRYQAYHRGREDQVRITNGFLIDY